MSYNASRRLFFQPTGCHHTYLLLTLPPARDDFWHVGDRVDAREAVGAVCLEPPPHGLSLIAFLPGVVLPNLDRARAEL